MINDHVQIYMLAHLKNDLSLIFNYLFRERNIVSHFTRANQYELPVDLHHIRSPKSVDETWRNLFDAQVSMLVD